MKAKIEVGARIKPESLVDKGVVRMQIPVAKTFVIKKPRSKNPGCVTQVTSLDPNQTYLDVVWPRTR